MDLNIILNKNLDFNILKKKNDTFIIIFNKLYYIKYKVCNKSKLFYNKNCKSLSLKFFFITINNKYLGSLIQSVSFSIYSYYTNKIIFTGKSYKIKKKKKLLYAVFNKSHKELFYWKNIFLKKIKKNKILIKSSNTLETENFKKKIIGVRKINIFNKRGLRCSRDFIYVKKGKKSS